jgi:broad specificity phosphatase PhoE
VSLSAAGLAQAEALARALKEEPIAGVQSSPEVRCIQTANAIARLLELPVEIEPALDEIDFGEWSGRSFASLGADPQWEQWNSQRERAAPPGGESMAEAQARILSHMARTREAGPNACIAMVTHAEIIRAVVLNAAGMPLRDWAAIEVEPASIMRMKHWAENRVQADRGIAA